ncbi:hypothetical protein EI42_00134 [Thermosporothrix hazakensis]|jgi:anti-sigma factor RsiW|uniref:Putative zinc-finger domain-containing protein n=2 Tax=Thermosporothrix TaxID=768650 RepID=A0A326UBU1_THEHA|nr:zf-HC2 domain-containing protein [Thermosporothrix hazakensis]PZW35967.1 hypothetical protein EI42_00134 [Thermosporothrix hazakensis]BBH88436.1 hypothetical protein KTC_31870 [Thermosporothrix sp. COM3]GCE46622.1 hypothetical protein KTH_14910 [Thermosporothrix hazakensis]
MECQEPGAIRDEELIAYLSGEQVRPAVVRHLARCSACAALVNGYQFLDAKLQQKLYRWNCPPSLLLGEYQMGLLDSTQEAALREHLRICARCTQEAAALTALIANDPLFAVHQPLPEAQKVGVQLSHILHDLQEGTRRILATLLPQPANGGYALRQASVQTSEWPRRYQAGAIQISLQLERETGGRQTLVGLITRKDAALGALQGIPVALLSDETEALYTQRIDDLGNVIFPELPPALYTLEVHFPDGTIVVEQIPLNG